MSETEMLERPFYFILVVWGERFRNYFLDLGLPTLLSARNLPSLRTRQRSKFLFCTRPDDWAAIRGSPIFKLMERYVDPVYIEIPPCPPGVLGCVHMGLGHRRACELAYEAKAYPFVLTPDCIFSDGTIARLQELALAGIQLALVPALRFAEEPLFDELQKIGISPSERTGAEPITITNRELVRISLASMHSETKTYEWNAPFFHPIPAAAWWRVPGENGIIVHCLSWAPLLFDFAAVPRHDISVFDDWTFDGDYIYKNLGNISRIHLVLDSDEIFMASWAPLADKPCDLKPQRLLETTLVGNFVKKQRFNAAFYGGFYDPLKQRIFFEAARWHSKPVNDKWGAVERKALKILQACAAPPDDAKEANRGGQLGGTPGLSLGDRPVQYTSLLEHVKNKLTVGLLRRIVVPLFRLFGVMYTCWVHREAIIPRLRQVAQGDRDVLRWVNWRIRHLAFRLIGRTLYDPKPPRPSR